MPEREKTLKDYAKEAKKRMKQGFWQDYQNNLKVEIERAKESGVSVNKVVEYYNKKASESIKEGDKSDEEFYLKVKKILEEEGEVSNVIGRLTDENTYNQLSYEERQRYTLTLSEKYLKALERYKKDKQIGV